MRGVPNNFATGSEISKSEPYWAVLTNDKYRKMSIDEIKTHFFEEGKSDTKILITFAKRHNIDLHLLDTCFEIGCGIGRVTVHLAIIFNKAVGWDNAEPMIAEAKLNAVKFSCNNVTLHTVKKFTQFCELTPFGCFFSRIVLQHNPPPVAYFMLYAG